MQSLSRYPCWQKNRVAVCAPAVRCTFRGVVLALVLLAWPGAARGQVGDDIIVDHPPLNTGGPAADTEFINMFGQPSWQLSADDILLDAPATVRRVMWWGFYDQDNPPTEETMRIRFYDARPGDGLPGGILFEEYFQNPTRVATGRRVFVSVDPAEYEYTVDMAAPFHLLADTPYWLEIVQVGDIDTAFRWEFAFSDQNGYAFSTPSFPNWRASNLDGDLAFRLSSIPEPASVWILAAALMLVNRCRKEVKQKTNRRARRTVAAAALLCLLAWPGAARGQAGDDIIVDHPPHPFGGPAADTEFINMFGQPSWQLLADDILLDAPATVRRVMWWGFYDQDNPPAEETMRLRFYDARPGDGLPGDILFEESFMNPSRVATGRRIPVSVSPREFVYEVDLGAPFVLAADTLYWMEIVQVGVIDTAFRWEQGLGELNGFAFRSQRFPEWQDAGFVTDLAFQLSRIPEPGTLGLLGIVEGRRKRNLNSEIPR
jgi:hypothetical protein